MALSTGHHGAIETTPARATSAEAVCSSCLRCDDAEEAQIISPPVGLGRDPRSSRCYVTYRKRICDVSWKGSMAYPDLSSYPQGPFLTSEVKVSEEMAEIYAGTSLVNYGADGCVRCSHMGPFPIVKVALPNDLSRSRISYEYDMLCQMGEASLPVPLTDRLPLRDHQGVIGYRMESLLPLPYPQREIGPELREVVDRLHDAGFVHGDLTPSNVMRANNGDLKVIDVAYSGKLGASIPDQMPRWKYKDMVFDKAVDYEYIQRFFG